MGRSDELAAAVEAVNRELVSFTEACSADQWATVVPGECWTVAVIMHHCAMGHDLAMSWIGELLESGKVSMTSDEIDAINAVHAEEFTGVGIAETAALVRSTGARAVEYLRALSDAELDRQGSFGPGGGSTVTVERLAGLLSRHPLTHIAHVRNALNLA